MEMHQIRYFLAVERDRNFSRAAESCNITQPALTRAIQKLEEEIGGKLFLRRPGNIELTELGRALLPRLEHAFNEIADARSFALDLTRERKQRLRLGVMCTIGPERLMSLVKPVISAIGDLQLHLTESKGTEVVTDLLNDEIDVAVVGLPSYPDSLEAYPLYNEQYAVAVPAAHRLAAANAVELRELNGENYIERLNCEFDDHFDFAHGEWPIEMNVRCRSEREDWVQAMITSGVGIAILPQSFPVLPGISTAQLIAPEIARTISIVTVRDRPLPPTAAAYVRLIKAITWI